VAGGKKGTSTVLRIVREIARFNLEFVGAMLHPHAYLLARNKEEAKEISEAPNQGVLPCQRRNYF
jgi:hypothetical protein